MMFSPARTGEPSSGGPDRLMVPPPWRCCLALGGGLHGLPPCYTLFLGIVAEGNEGAELAFGDLCFLPNWANVLSKPRRALLFTSAVRYGP